MRRTVILRTGLLLKQRLFGLEHSFEYQSALLEPDDVALELVDDEHVAASRTSLA